MMDDLGPSDPNIVPQKPPNKAEAAEVVEGRAGAKGNAVERHTLRTQSRPSASQGLDRVREAARRNRDERFTALLHHVYDIERLRAAYFALKRDAAAGVDEETWQHYGEDLAAHLADLSGRLQRGAYRVQPVKRVYIPKGDGRDRPLGVPTLEDKLVQRAVAEVLSAIYETDFLGFSYGFRPGRSQHDALDGLSVGLVVKKVNWVLDADLQSFFDTMKHDWLLRFLEHRLADQRILRLIQKWLTAGVLEDGAWHASEEGTVQGGSISPLLANVYLHYVLDLWAHQWRQREATGDVVLVRFADDFVVGFQHRTDAERFRTALGDRVAQFGLKLHPDKTRLIEFGRFAASNRRSRGDGKPETFNFLGFTHSCGTTQKGAFMVRRTTMRRRWQAKVKAVSAELRRRLHDPIPEVGAYLASVVGGHMRYYAVPFNRPSVMAFRRAIERTWWRILRRRSQRARLRWDRMGRLLARYLPPVRICHPYPSVRFAAVRTQGGSRMR